MKIQPDHLSMDPQTWSYCFGESPFIWPKLALCFTKLSTLWNNFMRKSFDLCLCAKKRTLNFAAVLNPCNYRDITQKPNRERQCLTVAIVKTIKSCLPFTLTLNYRLFRIYVTMSRWHLRGPISDPPVAESNCFHPSL